MARRKGGLKSLSQTLSRYGEGDDKILAHINPQEAAYLESNFGMDFNPHTGLPQFGRLGRFFRKFEKRGIRPIARAIEKPLHGIEKHLIRPVSHLLKPESGEEYQKRKAQEAFENVAMSPEYNEYLENIRRYSNPTEAEALERKARSDARRSAMKMQLDKYRQQRLMQLAHKAKPALPFVLGAAGSMIGGPMGGALGGALGGASQSKENMPKNMALGAAKGLGTALIMPMAMDGAKSMLGMGGGQGMPGVPGMGSAFKSGMGGASSLGGGMAQGFSTGAMSPMGALSLGGNMSRGFGGASPMKAVAPFSGTTEGGFLGGLGKMFGMGGGQGQGTNLMGGLGGLGKLAGSFLGGGNGGRSGYSAGDESEGEKGKFLSGLVDNPLDAALMATAIGGKLFGKEKRPKMTEEERMREEMERFQKGHPDAPYRAPKPLQRKVRPRREYGIDDLAAGYAPSPYFEEANPATEYAHGGYVDGDSGGQEDDYYTEIPEGSFVWNATDVSLIGDGNSKAGKKTLTETEQKALRSGIVRNYQKPQKVKVYLSSGEHVSTPEAVKAMGGPAKIEKIRKNLRKHKGVKSILPPKTKPLQKYAK